jgi:hypothetical protein
MVVIWAILFIVVGLIGLILDRNIRGYISPYSLLGLMVIDLAFIIGGAIMLYGSLRL